MFRAPMLIATFLAIVTWKTAATAAPVGPNENASLIATSAQAKDGEVVEVTNLQPFTHVAYIPEGADLSSIKIEGVKAVKIPTKRRSVTNPRYCDQSWSDPGGSMYCPFTTDESPVPAYRVTYSFQGQPMMSDEYGNTRFTFSVYFGPDALSPELRRAVSTGTLRKSAAAELFDLTTYRDSIRQLAIDQPNSIFCEGNYVDGNWVHKNPECVDRIAYRTVVSPSPNITVKIDPALFRLERVAAGSPSWQK
jgi:hypothetical protein